MPRNVIDDLPPIKTGPLIMYMTCWVVAGPPLGLAGRGVLNANDTLGGRGPPLMQTTTNDRWMDDNKKKIDNSRHYVHNVNTILGILLCIG